MDETSKLALGILAIAGIIGAIVYFATRQRNVVAPERSLSPRHYSNEERWSVTYSEDGLPTEIVIHRNTEEA